MKKEILWLLPIFIFIWIFSGCTPNAKYERMLKRELKSGIRNDTLFMGIHFGMSEKEFYTRCWDLNKQGLIKQGMRNMTVEYILKDELKYPGTMDFYPEFVDGIISELPVQFLYNGWTPWNKSLSTDSLQVDVLKWYEKQYGNGFLEVEHSKRGIAYVKIDGNRRISIFKGDDMHVWAVFTNMLVEQELKNAESKIGDIQKDISNRLEQ